MIVALVQVGENPGKPTFLTPKEVEERFTTNMNGQKFCTQVECVWWAKNGKHGSHFQVGQDMFIRIRDEKDDPMQYYTPEAVASARIPFGNFSGGGKCSGGNCGNCSC